MSASRSESETRVAELARTVQTAIDASFHATGPPYGFTHAQYDEAYVALPGLLAIIAAYAKFDDFLAMLADARHDDYWALQAALSPFPPTPEQENASA